MAFHLSVETSDETNENSHSKHFRLLDLPPESWSRIGKLAVDHAPHLTFLSISTPTQLKSQQPAITCVCHVLRHEILPYCYRTKVCMSTQKSRSHTHKSRMMPDTRTGDDRWVHHRLSIIGHESIKNVRGLSFISSAGLAAAGLQKPWRFAREFEEASPYEPLRAGTGLWE